LLNQLIGIASLLSRRSCKFRLEFGREKYLHEGRSRGKRLAWQALRHARNPNDQ
jgi:hypothetical protein